MHHMPRAPHDGLAGLTEATAVAIRQLASDITVAAACACCMASQRAFAWHHRGHSQSQSVHDTPCLWRHKLALPLAFCSITWPRAVSGRCTALCAMHALQADVAGISPGACLCMGPGFPSAAGGARPGGRHSMCHVACLAPLSKSNEEVRTARGKPSIPKRVLSAVGIILMLFRTPDVPGALQACNPLPFVFIVFNCCAWTTYAVVTRDPFVFLANDPGVLLGLYYLFSAYGLADEAVSPGFCLGARLPTS